MAQRADSAPTLALLQTAPAAVRADFARAARRVTFRQGQLLMSPGARCEAIVFPIEGALRVYQTAEDGRAVTLYRVRAEEACVLSVASVLGARAFPALVESECDGAAWAVPSPVFFAWVERHAFWRSFVFGQLAQRLGDVLARLDAVTFRRLDARVAAWLLEHPAQGGRVACTHQEIATALGTAREVVSRILADWQRRGWVRTARGTITLADRRALQELAEKLRAV
jgi:CRP/FNR family transcriptional regulator